MSKASKGTTSRGTATKGAAGKAGAGRGRAGRGPAFQPRGRTGPPVFSIVIGAVVVLGVVAVVLVAITSEGEPLEVGTVEVEGTALAPYQSGAPDAALGTTAPTLSGEDFGGDAVEIAPGGTKKAVAFLAHWCPHCQAEAPRLAAWLDAGNLPDNVELYLVPTATNRGRGNYPPSDWLDSEGLGDVPTLVDDEATAAAASFGLSGYPYWVFLDEDHAVQGRISGELAEGAFDELFGALSAGLPLTGEPTGEQSDA